MNFFVYCILFQLIVAITPGDKVGYNLPQLGENQTGVKGVPSNQISNSNQNSNTNSNTNTNNQNIQSNPSKNTNTNNNNNNNNNNVQPNESKNNNPLSQSNDNKNNKQSNVDKATIQESKSSSEKTVESISTTPTTTSSSISSISPTTTSKSNEKTSSHNATSTDPTLICLVESGCGPDIKCISRCAKVPNPNSDQVRRTGACMGRCNTTEHPLPPPNGEQVLQDRIATCYQKCLKGIYLAHFTKPKYRDIGVNSGSDGKGLIEIMIVIMAVIVFSFGV